MNDFETQLIRGKAGESVISKWLIGRGFAVLPAYEKIINTGKGPQLFTPKGCFVAPDLLAFKGDRILWVEAKHKTAFAWHRISQQWTTGIDLNHYEHYKQVQDLSHWDVWLLFLHDGGQAKDSPPNSPSGLYGNSLDYLSEHENHRHMNWGRHGMVYWGIGALRKLPM